MKMRRIMWSKGVGALVALMASVFMLVGSPVASASPALQPVQQHHAQLINARDMFPGSVYDNPQTRDVRFARGDVWLTPNANGSVRLQIVTHNLKSQAAYRVYIDTNGVHHGRVSTAGPWTQYGTFTTNRGGNGVTTFTISAGAYKAGPHVWSVFINNANRFGSNTVLISRNLVFAIPSHLRAYTENSAKYGVPANASGSILALPMANSTFTKSVSLTIDARHLRSNVSYQVWVREDSGAFKALGPAVRTNNAGQLHIGNRMYTFANPNARLEVAINLVSQNATWLYNDRDPIYLNGVSGQFRQ